MREKLDILRKDRFLELKSWAGLSDMPGTHGLIITNDKKIYYYQNYHHVPSSLEGKFKLEDISFGGVISVDVYNKLANYINENIIGKKFENVCVRDAGCNVIGNGFNICNQFEICNDLMKIIGGKL